MKLRFISPDMHGTVDYGAGIMLIAAPFIIGLGSSNAIAPWISVVTGAAVLVVSALTDYKLSLFRTIPFDGHLAIDLMAATAFMAVPFLFNLEGLDAYYYWVNAAVVYLVVALTDSKQNNYSQ